jgi:saccharopine dehydrogenase-like NADP-dependent oxidoreductase
MEYTVVILGAGMVGSTMARDLAGHFRVTSVDVSSAALTTLKEADPRIEVQVADLSDPEVIKSIVQPFDLVVGAVPGFLGRTMFQAVLEAGKNIVDISFPPQDLQTEFNSLAEAKGLTALIDCGIAPGMSNLLLGFFNSRMQIHSFTCYVGGLPDVRTLPFQYKAPFSPIDVVEEYIRPARLIRAGSRITLPALTELELLEFPEVGTLEAFNTDGLRSILNTMSHIPNLSEKTLRYPGHCQLMQTLISAGFFSTEPVKANGSLVRPIDVNAQVCLAAWKKSPNEPEFTIFRATAEGTRDGVEVKESCDIFDRYDPETKVASMSRTTGFTATAIVHAFFKGLIPQKGVLALEQLAANPGLFDHVLEHHRSRKVRISLRI